MVYFILILTLLLSSGIKFALSPTYACIMDSYFIHQFSFIPVNIYFGAQIVTHLASDILFNLLSMSFFFIRFFFRAV